MRKCLPWTAAFVCLVTIICVARLYAQDAVNSVFGKHCQFMVDSEFESIWKGPRG